jgi:hypothetical protein
MVGGGGKDKSSPGIDQLLSMAAGLNSEVSPLRQAYGKQSLEALKTGGITAAIPIINRAVEASRSSLSSTLNSMNEDLAKYRLTGTPFGQQIYNQARIGGEANVANIAPQYAANFINQIPSFVSAITGQAVQGMGAGAGAQGGVIQSDNAGRAQTSAAFIQMMGDLAKATGAAMGKP